MTDKQYSDSCVVSVYAPELTLADLYHESWNQCQPVFITHQWSGVPAPASRHAEVRLCWNNIALLAKFVCHQHEPLIVSEDPVTNVKTIGLWNRDVCEIFVAPDVSNPNTYFEFEAAPTGEWIDLAIQINDDGRQTEWDYESGMTTIANLGKNQIIVGLSIPWSKKIPKPNEGDEWRANLFRCVGPDEATRYLAWRPTMTPEPNFHLPSAFGSLLFG